MTFSISDLKNTFTRYGTGVTVVSCVPEGAQAPIGITVNSFTSVSLEPALVLWCIDRNSGVFEAFLGAEHYAVTILRDDQAAQSTRFATPGNHAFEPDETEVLESGVPVLKERLAALDCKVVARHEAGDHVILIGQILACDYRTGKPLLYVARNYLSGPEIV